MSDGWPSSGSRDAKRVAGEAGVEKVADELSDLAGTRNAKRIDAYFKQGGFTSGPLIVECLENGDLTKLAAEAKKARLFLEQLLGQEA